LQQLGFGNAALRIAGNDIVTVRPAAGGERRGSEHAGGDPNASHGAPSVG